MDLDFTRRVKRKWEIADLCEDILACVPLKPRTNFKCVSKSWCRIITNLRHSHPPTTSSGLVLFYEVSGSIAEFEATLLTVQDQGKECILQSSLKVDLINPLLKLSFRGMLLYHNNTQFYVSSPVINQCIDLPPPINNNNMELSTLYVGLFPHQSRKKDQFNLICFNTNPDYFCGTINYQMISSNTLEWRTHRAPLYNGSFYCSFGMLHLRNYFHCVYNNGKLYWLFGHLRWPLMLVYNIDREFFKLVVLPAQRTKYHLLYESQDCLYYCESTRIDLVIWAYLDDEGDGNGYDDDSKNNRDRQLRWRITHSMPKCKLIEQIEGTKDAGIWMVPVAFNSELQILYLMDKFIIWAYSIETQRITKVWTFGPNVSSNLSRFCIQPFDLSLMPTLEYLNNHATGSGLHN